LHSFSLARFMAVIGICQRDGESGGEVNHVVAQGAGAPQRPVGQRAYPYHGSIKKR
jgi:hypothetical protein